MVSYIPKSCPFLISLSAFFVILMEDMEDNKIEEVLEVKFMLAAKIITEKNFNRARVRSILYKSWMNVKLHIADLSPHLYLISFIAEEDMQKILTESPWSMMGQLVNLKRWEKVIPINNIDFSKTPFWIQIHGLSEDQLTLKNAQEIGETLGEVLEAENPMEGGLVRRNFLRVRVMIDLQMPLVAGFWSPIPGNAHTWLDLSYEKLSRFCYKCGLIGHVAKNCTDVVTMSTVDPDLPRYGPWLRASPETTLVMTKQHSEKSEKAETRSIWHSVYERRQIILLSVKKGFRHMLEKLSVKSAPDAKEATKEAHTYGELTSASKDGGHTYGELTSASKDGAPTKAHNFTFRELAVATANFKAEYLLGKGSLGEVYKGRLERTDQVVAIKKLSCNMIEGSREFVDKVLILSLLQHPNLVKLIGYCIEDRQRLLVYEYMPLGSLKYHLHDLSPDRRPLDWNTRMKVAAGIAEALGYLHNNANPIIIGGFKSSNILLGEGYHPKLYYYGLSKPEPLLDTSFVQKDCVYSAPEYQRTGQATLKSDVYSFGVVLLEIITGRKPFDNSRGFSEKDLLTWARPLFRDRAKFPKMADPLLGGEYPMRGLYQALAVAAMCIQEQLSMRPVIDDVISAIKYLASQNYVPKTQSVHGSDAVASTS